MLCFESCLFNKIYNLHAKIYKKNYTYMKFLTTIKLIKNYEGYTYKQIFIQ